MPETLTRLTTGQKLQRTVNAQIRAVNDDSRTLELSFSSEEPYTRWWGSEILSHDEGAIDLTRLIEVGTVLFTHGKDPKFGRMPIAKIEKAWLDSSQHKAKALITFDDDEDSEKVYQKVKKEMIKGVSVGYIVSSWEEVAPGKKSANGRFTGPADVAVKWEPLEISIEPTPADPMVGVGRSAEEAAGENQNSPRKGERNSLNIYERQLQINKNYLC